MEALQIVAADFRQRARHFLVFDSLRRHAEIHLLEHLHECRNRVVAARVVVAHELHVELHVHERAFPEPRHVRVAASVIVEDELEARVPHQLYLLLQKRVVNHRLLRYLKMDELRLDAVFFEDGGETLVEVAAEELNRGKVHVYPRYSHRRDVVVPNEGACLLEHLLAEHRYAAVLFRNGDECRRGDERAVCGTDAREGFRSLDFSRPRPEQRLEE